MAEDANIFPLENFESTGHWICYGPSESGKTTFARHMINRMVKEKKVPWDNIFVFCADEVAYQHESIYPHVYTDWDTSPDGPVEQLKRISNQNFDKITGEGGCVILFDDFNELIPYGDKEFEVLFTKGRHAGIRCIVVSHSATSVQKKCRENIKYAAVLPKVAAKHQLIHEISKLFAGQDWKKIENALKILAEGDEFRTLILRNDGRMFYDDVDLKEDPYHKSAGMCDNMSAMSADMNNMGLDDNSSHNFGVSKTYYNTGQMLNQNTENYTIQNNVDLHSEIQQIQLNQKRTIMNYKFGQKMKMLQERDRCRELLLKWPKYRSDIDDIVRILRLLSNNMKINSSNYEPYAQKFMKTYFPKQRFDVNGKQIVMERGINYARDYFEDGSTRGIMLDGLSLITNKIMDKSSDDNSIIAGLLK